MGRVSSINKLPENLRKDLIKLLSDPSVTQAEVTELINLQAGEAVISKSAVNRYAVRMQRQIEKTRQAREVADAYLEKMSGNTSNKLGKVVNQQIRLMAFDLVMQVEKLKEKEELDPKVIIDLISRISKGLKELEQAEKINADRSDSIRKEALADAVRVIEAQSEDGGISKKTFDLIKKELLGL